MYAYTTHTFTYPYEDAKHKFAHHIYVYGKEKEILKKRKKILKGYSVIRTEITPESQNRNSEPYFSEG